MEQNQRNNKKFYVPIICIAILVLIVVLAVLIIGIHATEGGEQGIAKTFKNLILGATDLTSVEVGDDVIANFTSSTGAVTITSTYEKGTIDEREFQKFLYNCGHENIKTITFTNAVYAPTNSDIYRK